MKSLPHWVFGLGLLAFACGSPSGGTPAKSPAACPPAAGSESGPELASAGAGGVNVTLDGDGRAFIAGQGMFQSQDYARALGTNTSEAVIVADARVPHGRVMAVAAELTRAGVKKVRFATSAAPMENVPVAPAASATEPPPATSATAVTAVEPPATPPDPSKALPEVKIENVGMHIGGGPNDDASKAPYLKAVERHFDEFRACYVKVEEPAKGGTYGVDFHIGRNGGKAELKQPRTGMKGNEFRKCVLGVFESIEFDKPQKGATVVSYSLRFSLGK